MYEFWYDRVMVCCIKAGARKYDEAGNCFSFDHNKDVVIKSKNKNSNRNNKKAVNKP